MKIKARTPAPLSWAPGGPVTNCQHLTAGLCRSRISQLPRPSRDAQTSQWLRPHSAAETTSYSNASYEVA